MSNERDLREYIASEKFIHDDLLKNVEGGLPSITTSWRSFGRIAPFMLSWPEDDVVGDDGSVLNVVLCELPEEPAKRASEIVGFITRTQPYALMICEQLENEVCIIFESRHGTKSWVYPIEKHGPDRVLGQARVEVDKKSLGILWRPQVA